MNLPAMRPFLHLLHRFGQDERGVFAIIFGLLAIVLVALGGAVVDYVSLEQTRTRAQVALDAAALALQPNIFLLPLNRADIQAKAEALLDERLGDPDIARIESIDINVAEGSLLLRAYLQMDTIFVSLVGVQQMSARLLSEATRRRLALEIAMVLDNSGSMTSYNRMTYLKDAARCATNIIFYDSVNATTCNPNTGAVKSDEVKIGIVPFTMYVNVGPSNASANWIDKDGRSPLANDNFDNDDDDATPFNGLVNRLALYDAITNDDWRGCVEARPHDITAGSGTHFYDTDDTVPQPYVSASQPGDPKSLFVPLFAPDLSETTVALGNTNNYRNDSPASCNRPSGTGTNAATCTEIENRNSCNSAMSNCTSVNSTFSYTFTGPTSGSVNGRVVGAYPPSCSCPSTWTYSAWVQTSGSGNNRTFTRNRTCSGTAGYTPTGLSQREFQERLCKYSGALSYTTAQKGPNADCPSAALTPLTATPATVTSAIAAMVADGGTNIHEGAAWGFRVLSPTAPFTQGEAYDEATAKIMIVMTDGENTAYQTGNLNGSSYHSAYGYPYNARLGTIASTNPQLVTEMNARTVQTCTNAKAQGITVYTIGLSTDQVTQSTTAVVQKMLRDCATSSAHAYFPNNPSELKSVFQAIAGQLAALRLAQ